MLAQQARTVLASGRTGLLALPCERVRGWVGLIDDGGEPLLMVGAGSPPARAAMDGRRSRVDIPGHHGERLILAGSLRAIPGTTEQILRRLDDLGRSVTLSTASVHDLQVLAVSVDEVMLCVPSSFDRDAGGERGRVLERRRPRRWPPSTAGQRIELSAYALAEPDLIAAYAPDLIDHLNAEHAAQMRQLAHHAVPLSSSAEIVGVQVSGLDRLGLDLWRVSIEGAEKARVTFRNPLTEPRSLGQELRWLLDQPARSSD